MKLEERQFRLPHPGTEVIIEFSPQGLGGDPTMHVHTIYRDPTNDYGVKLTGAS